MLRERIGSRLAVGFIWFWSSWMSFGVWAFFFGGGRLPKADDYWPWPPELYLGIPVAAAFGAVVAFFAGRHLD